MNYLVFLDAKASELEKILSGTKSMVVKESNPASAAGRVVSPGDSLYFLRNKDDCELRVKATVSRVIFLGDQTEEDFSHIWKEMQPRLQLTEDQYNHWSTQKQVALVEFHNAHKIKMTWIDLNKIVKRTTWFAFEEFTQIT
jgi:hypothetical protein